LLVLLTDIRSGCGDSSGMIPLNSILLILHALEAFSRRETASLAPEPRRI